MSQKYNLICPTSSPLIIALTGPELLETRMGACVLGKVICQRQWMLHRTAKNQKRWVGKTFLLQDQPTITTQMVQMEKNASSSATGAAPDNRQEGSGDA